MFEPSLKLKLVSTGLEVLVDCPGIQGLYTYRIPDDLVVNPGDILSVPFGGQLRSAIAIRFVSLEEQPLEISQLREIDAVISRGFFSKVNWQLLDRVAHYYQTPLIQVIRAALPPGLLAKSQRRIRLNPDSIPTDAGALLSQNAQQLLQTLQSSPMGDYTWQYLQRQHRGAQQALQQLLQRGWVKSYLQPPQPPQPKQRQAVALTVSAPPRADSLTPRQQELVMILRQQGGELWLSDALQRLRTTSATLKKLESKGYLTIGPREVLRVGAHSSAAPDQPKSLTPDQAQVLQTINTLTQNAQVLLHGVTGSGKTEVYLQAIAPRLATGKSCLVLVPEIGLTPQLTDRFRSRFGDQVCVYHSALSDGERYDTWRHMLTDTPQVIIGTRSAVFAPLPNLGLIILDEEHDSSFKQDQPMPCYHARTVAQWRAELSECPLVLGSATPSVESWVGIGNEVEGRENWVEGRVKGERRKTKGASVSHTRRVIGAGLVPGEGNNPESNPTSPPPHLPTSPSTPHSPLPTTHYLSLPTRINSRPLPPVEIIDMRKELHAGNRSIFSRALQQGFEQMKAAGNQGLLFIHRRGHSSFVSCRSCGYVMECPHCDVSLSYHQLRNEAVPYLRCHYCGYGQSHPPNCPDCGSPYLKNFGSGTQRVVNELAKHFPELSCIRFDSDTTRTKGAHRALLGRFAQGEADLLVGTQMLTKGIDLPQVTLVGVLAADGLLYMADYRASERAFQTLTQVAGRAGRGEEPGRVILQTYTPDHPVIGAVKHHNYEAFIKAELADREALAYPPYGRLALLRITGTDPVTVEKTAEEMAYSLGTRSSKDEQTDYEILGPAPAPIARVARRYRWHVLIKLPANSPVPDLRPLRQQCPKDISLTIDVDPLNLS